MQDGVMSDDEPPSMMDRIIETDGKPSSLQPSQTLSFSRYITCQSCFFPHMRNGYAILSLLLLLYRTRYCV